MKVSELLARSLESYGVQRAYGLVGTSILELMDALSSSKIRYVSTRHEQVAVSMADAEGRVTGRPGIALVHGGPGFLNSLVSLSNAWKDCSPMVLVAGAVKRRMVGMDSWLEVPQGEMVRTLVKKAWRVERSADAGRVFSEAFGIAMALPHGPVLVEVPEDVWALEAGGEVIPLRPQPQAPVRGDEVTKVADALSSAQRPVVVVGGGMNYREGSDTLEEFLQKSQVPVVTSGNGRGGVSEDNPLVLGRIGFGGGNGAADYALGRADVVVCLGAGLSDVSTYGFNLTPKGKVFAVDMDPLWDRKPVPKEMHSAADCVAFTRELSKVCRQPKIEPWVEEIERERKRWKVHLSEAISRTKEGFVNPAKFLAALDSKLPDDAIVAAGQGLHVLYAYSFLKVRAPGSFLAATNMGSMGFVFPAALGAKMACPEREVVAVMGDGEFLMTMQDLETAVREKIGAKVIVVNDNSYRVLLMRQKIQKMGRIHGTRHSNPDMEKLARAFGAEAVVVKDDGEIERAVEFVTKKSSVPIIVELRIDPEDLPPLNLQGSLMF